MEVCRLISTAPPRAGSSPRHGARAAEERAATARMSNRAGGPLPRPAAAGAGGSKLIRRRATIPPPFAGTPHRRRRRRHLPLSLLPRRSLPPLCDGASSNGWDHAGV
jgi:hypothetical protein